jgi:cytochrome c biogenesis protein CcdA
MKNLLKPTAVPATILGTIILAFSVNLIEFFCSAGFPVMYTRILALQQVGTFKYYLYLIFYDLFYMLDDFIVFGFAFFALNHFNFSDKYNRYSTLVAGVMILILGALLIFKPSFLIFG